MTPVVIDTGVFATGVFWRSEPHKCVRAWLLGLFSLAISEAIYREYERTLHKDDIIIEAALDSHARTIIARDADLTTLKRPFGIHIVTPRQWLATLPRESRRLLD